ncbi:hypothetical protein MD535_13830 [Vibrio sp. ZSDZ65]|uniref:Uncharacterized protein n=1 Tax=Vibrio qingdaonensis TaxID=2829491 RepID=A0A9X3CQ89_9VIBR|nr:hypothetical protein [Vibrio qingdaonensis]MCW8347079.1 hypothetical protein [Vibrio qingdaonensis]
MSKIFIFITLSNAASLLLVFLFQLTTGLVRLNFASDYAFYTMLILFGLGAFFSFSGHKVGYSDPNNVAGVAASQLIENTDPKSYIVTKLVRTTLSTKFFLAGVFPLVFCVLY